MRLLVIFFIVVSVIACSDTKEGKKENQSGSVRIFVSPAEDSCAEPYLFSDKSGTVYLSWIEKKNKTAALKFSSLNNDQWSSPVTIASGNNWFVNWADYPVIAADTKGNLIAHYLEKSDTGKFTYDIKITLSSDTGKTWSATKLLNEDSIRAEHGFVSIVPYNDGFFACWLDGRKTGGAEHEGHAGHHGEMTMRAAILDKKGNKTNEWELDERVCDCCQTTATMTDAGPVVIYRDRSEDEVRDMSIVRYVNGQWTDPVSIYADNWKINACPVNGPRVSAIGNQLVVAWFTMKDKKGEVKLMFSTNGGATFGTLVRIDEGNAIGRVDAELLDSTTAIVSWMEGGDIKAAKVLADGTKKNSVMIASSSDKRSSGFPQMVRSGNRIFFAWTDDKSKTVRVAEMK